MDIDPAKVDALNAGRSYIKHIAPEAFAAAIGNGSFRTLTDFNLIAGVSPEAWGQRSEGGFPAVLSVVGLVKAEGSKR